MREIALFSLAVMLTASITSCLSGPPVQSGTSPALSIAPAGRAEKADWELEWERTLDAGRKEGKVVLLTTAGADIRTGITRAIKEKYGLDMEFVTGSGASSLIAKQKQEREAGLYIGDAYMTGISTLLSTAKPAGLLDPMRSELILPEVVDPKYWYGNKLPFVDKDEYFFGFRGGPQRLLYVNTDMVKPQEMRSYKDLLNPKFKGKITMGDPTTGGSASTFVTMVAEYFMGYDFIRELAKQEPFLTRDDRLLVEWVARGKYPVLIGVTEDFVASFMLAGAPIVDVIPEEGTLVNPGGGTITLINRRPHPNAARVFLNWLLGKEGQVYYARTAMAESSRVDVGTEHLDPRLTKKTTAPLVLAEEKFYIKAVENQRAFSKEVFGPFLK